MRKNIKDIIKLLGRLRPFLSPYQVPFVTAILMSVASVAAITTAPRIEGMITSRLAADLADMASGVAGAHIHFDVIRNILLVLLAIYLAKTFTQIIGSFCLTNSCLLYTSRCV